MAVVVAVVEALVESVAVVEAVGAVAGAVVEAERAMVVGGVVRVVGEVVGVVGAVEGAVEGALVSESVAIFSVGGASSSEVPTVKVDLSSLFMASVTSTGATLSLSAALSSSGASDVPATTEFIS